MNIEIFKRLLNKVFLIIPVLLILLSFYLLLVNGPGYSGATEETWKTYWHLALNLFLLSFIVLLVFFVVSPSKSFRRLITSYKSWFLGLILSMFSFTIVALLTDLGYLVRIIIFRK